MLDIAITRLAAWLSRPVGFVATLGSIVAGLVIGIPFGFDDHWLLAFNLWLSILAIVIGGLILVAGAKDTAALHAKADELIRAIDAADNALIGIDLRSAQELDEARAECRVG